MGWPATETWQWTADAFERAGEAGLFGEDAKADLIDGEVHILSPQSPLHAYVLGVLDDARGGIDPALVSRTQSPVRLDARTELEPDLWTAIGPRERYGSAHPGPEDLRLVVEVSVNTLGFDAGDKLRAYARHSVPEVWVVDVAHRQVLLYSMPAPAEGLYTHIETRTAGAINSCGLEVRIEELWPLPTAP